MKKNGASGFTLIEIIVVLIIVGVLAAIALPNLFSNVNRSKGAEALASLGPIKTQIEGCLQAQASWPASIPSNCTFTPTASNVFTFSVGGNATNFAFANAATKGQTSDYIQLTRDSAQGGKWTCSGGGIYGGIC